MLLEATSMLLVLASQPTTTRDVVLSRDAASTEEIPSSKDHASTLTTVSSRVSTHTIPVTSEVMSKALFPITTTTSLDTTHACSQADTSVDSLVDAVSLARDMLTSLAELRSSLPTMTQPQTSLRTH